MPRHAIADRFFTIDLGRRLADAFTDTRLVEITGGRTFLPFDEPEQMAQGITAFTPWT